MFFEFAAKIFGTSNDRALKALNKHVPLINALEPEMEALSDDALKAKTAEFRQRLQEGETLDDLMHEAFAVVREAAKRVLGQRHFDVQLVGGIALHQGKIAEMKTGEGKTLASTLPVYLNALSGKGAHVVTVNDYLAARDAENMGRLYDFLGMSVGVIVHDMLDVDRRAAYKCDVTYATNNELGFDYLRDNMKYELKQMVQRPFNFAIIDEVDSILIDEARTPLIISGPAEDSSEMYTRVNKIIPHLEETDYDLDEKMKTVNLNEDGMEKAEQLLAQHGLLTEGGLYDIQNVNLVHHLHQALRAHKLFSRDTDYIVKDDKVIIIDEFTGRMMEGRRFSEGLHQALEAKENTKIQNENQTLASITFQNYFRLYPKLSGMTGTAMTEASEFMEIYKLPVVQIATNLPIARADYDDQIYKTLDEKDEAIIDLIEDCYSRKQPVLVGTVSIEKSESLAAKLKKRKIPHEVLNARHHEREAFIVAQAGQPGQVTIATNMAGRGTDIQLGGNLEMRIEDEVPDDLPKAEKDKRIAKIKEEIAANKEIVKEAGGLYVIGTERHESRRIDNQLRGRSGRQGDPGASIFFISLQDDLMRLFNPDALNMVLANKNIGLRDGEALTHPWLSKALERAQTKVEAQNFEVRKNLLKYDDVMNDQRKVIYEQRREVMESDSVEDLVIDMRHDIVANLILQTMPPGSYAEQWDLETLKSESQRLLGLDLPFADWAAEDGIGRDEIMERLLDAADKKMANKAANAGPEQFRKIEKLFVLNVLDQLWKEHLLSLDHLRQGINLRAFGQRDPLNEFKTEAFAMFELLLDRLRETVTQTLSIIELQAGQEIPGALQRKAPDPSKLQIKREDPGLAGSGANLKQGDDNVQPIRNVVFDRNDPRTWTKVPRNAPCPCGSGKKFKHCHGKVLAAAEA